MFKHILVLTALFSSFARGYYNYGRPAGYPPYYNHVNSWKPIYTPRGNIDPPPYFTKQQLFERYSDQFFGLQNPSVHHPPPQQPSVLQPLPQHPNLEPLPQQPRVNEPSPQQPSALDSIPQQPNVLHPLPLRPNVLQSLPQLPSVLHHSQHPIQYLKGVDETYPYYYPYYQCPPGQVYRSGPWVRPGCYFISQLPNTPNFQTEVKKTDIVTEEEKLPTTELPSKALLFSDGSHSIEEDDSSDPHAIGLAITSQEDTEESLEPEIVTTIPTPSIPETTKPEVNPKIENILRESEIPSDIAIEPTLPVIVLTEEPTTEPPTEPGTTVSPDTINARRYDNTKRPKPKFRKRKTTSA